MGVGGASGVLIKFDEVGLGWAWRAGLYDCDDLTYLCDNLFSLSLASSPSATVQR